MAVVARAFPPQSRSVAVGIVGAAGSFGQFAMLPWAQAMISGFGWLNALLVFACLAFLMVPLGAALAGRNAAESESEQSIGAALAEATRHNGFWLLTGSFFVCGFQTIFVMTHLPAYLVDQGLSAGQGMTALAVIGLFNIVGSFGCGALGGRYSKRLILAWIYAIRAVAIAVFIAAPLTDCGNVSLRPILGLTWLGTVPLTNRSSATIFGVKYRRRCSDRVPATSSAPSWRVGRRRGVRSTNSYCPSGPPQLRFPWLLRARIRSTRARLRPA